MAELNWAQMSKDAATVLEGDFPVVFTDADATKSSNGKPMIKCKLKITAGPYAGRVVYHNFTVSPESPAAMKMLFTHFSSLGLGQAYFAKQPSLEQIASDLRGKTATATLEKREWQGVERENIKAFKNAAGGASGISSLGKAATLPAATTLPAAAAQQPVPVASGAIVTGAEEPPDDPF